MADADGRPASQDDASSSPTSHIHQVVDEAMTYLDPPPHESLTVDSVAHAYTILQQAASASVVSSNDNRRSMSHPRVQQIESILRHEQRTVENSDWRLEQTDLYRALLLSSFLLLEMASFVSPGGENTNSILLLLQSSVERCVLLLQILATNDDDDSPLPTSRHALLQAVLDEPLIPLHKQERQYTYILQRNKHNNDKHESNDDDTNSIGIEEKNAISAMDKRQLAREEQELIKLATRPIPLAGGVDQEKYAVPPPNHDETRPSPSSTIVQQGPLLWIHDANNNNSKRQTPCHVQLHACGLLIITTVEGTPNDIFYLTNTTTCEPRVHSQSLHIIIVSGECVSRGRDEMQQPTESFEFQADSLSVGYAWVTSIHQIITKLKQSASLQKELQLEYKEEYDAVKAFNVSFRAQRQGAGSIAYPLCKSQIDWKDG